MAAETEMMNRGAVGAISAPDGRTTERRGTIGGTANAAPSATLASQLVMIMIGAALVLSVVAYGAVSPWALAFFQASACLTFVLWGWDALASGGLRVSRNILQIPLLALVLIGAFQLLPLNLTSNANPQTGTITLDPFHTLVSTIKAGALLIYFAAALAFIDRPSRLRLVVQILIIFGFVLALAGLVQSFVSPESIYGIQTPNQAFPFGPFVNRHHFANYMLLALALPLGLLFANAVSRELRFLIGFAALIMGVALVATGSRGAMLSLVVQVGFLVVAAGLNAKPAEKRRRRSSRNRGRTSEEPEKDSGVTDAGEGEEKRRGALLWRIGAGAGLLTLLLGGVLLLGGESGLARLVGTVNSDDPTTGRTHFWAVTMRIIAERPLLGAGLGAYSLAYTRYDTRGGMYRIEQAHNDYLQLLSDTGIVGGVFGLLFVVALYRIGLRRLRSADVYRRGVALGALAGCTGAFVHSIFEFSLHTTSNALLFLVLAALATLGAQVEEVVVPKRRRRRAPATSSSTAAATSTDETASSLPVVTT